MNKLIYYFSKSASDGDSSMKNILGGKGANLAQMCKLGLSIPPGFTISSELCSAYCTKQLHLTTGFLEELSQSISRLEREVGKKFGSDTNPLLISVRSGAKVSMPGMMDTILNLGMNDEVAAALAKSTSNPKFAYDSYRRFLEMFATVVFEVSNYHFEEILSNHKDSNNISKDSDLTEEDLKKIIIEYKAVIRKYTGKEFESDPTEQLKHAIEAVLKSWMSPRAIAYRKIHNIDDDMGTAVTIQSMEIGRAHV